MAAKIQKGAANGCPKFFSPPENIWVLLRKTKEEIARMGDNSAKSCNLVSMYNQARTYFEENC
jgi:hypothetical protein